MGYAVKELFYSLQGEGAQAGRAAVFCRFAGCNLWSGREQDRASAQCRFCDTDFVGADGPEGGRFDSAQALADRILALWPAQAGQAIPYVVLTGGEPLLQLDEALINALHEREFEVALETNGTLEAPSGLDWICVSPKAGTTLNQFYGNELKLVYPQADLDPAQFEALNFRHFFLQPMDGPQRESNSRAALDYCLRRPLWRLGLQTHKLVGIR